MVFVGVSLQIGNVRHSVGACTIVQKIISRLLWMHIVLKQKEGIIIKFEGEDKIENIWMITNG